ncbi:LysE family translocator [Limnoraphis robusta]|uniref:LysE family translocator n=1 Tax=Limnoraphis robusta CCNP1315 TaxID=3110306 RepID=A0ABU5U6C0_9CYAN|nr:LysE family translocator [Limnoraphis robusta]MEA5498878.1 LysE family translocator [Limnoraphis robusta BA-68 BA1]MEA5522595.1 LysE family translocator [Limnoraphis robusta CCNP1315]MEA5546506.1 LysE family translocator [Limnoraphis robusta CCNP1324]
MEISFFLKGLLVGFSIAAPVGPIGVLCIRRSLTYGKKTGFISGLGAATADAMYGCIAGFGLSLVSNFLVSQQVLFKIFGGLFLCYLGWKTFLEKPATEAATSNQIAGAFASTFFLTITNPMTILSFLAIFAGLGLATANHYLDAVILVLGVFIGSASWWLLLASGVSLFREKFSDRTLKAVNQISGVIILGFGMIALVTGIKG